MVCICMSRLILRFIKQECRENKTADVLDGKKRPRSKIMRVCRESKRKCDEKT